MKILLAPDSFKGSASATQVCTALTKGILKALPEAEIYAVPMADGGEGTMETITNALGGEQIKTNVHDPLGRKITASYGLLADNSTAVIEMASASGLTLLKPEERNPLLTSTYGTGELMSAVLQRGIQRIVVCIGGSATHDGGAGMLQALGIRFLDAENKPIQVCGGNLHQIAHIDIKNFLFHAFGEKIEITVACDVSNPLLGEKGASQVFASQKGANSEMIIVLENNLAHFAQKTFEIFPHKKGLERMSGAGAAGGLGFGLMAYMGAKMQKGVEMVLEISQVAEKLATFSKKNRDFVITGEGSIDAQTVFGKVPWGVAQLAKKYDLPVIGICGSIGKGAELLYTQGIDSIFSILDKPMTLEEAMHNAPTLLEHLGERIGRLWAVR